MERQIDTLESLPAKRRRPKHRRSPSKLDRIAYELGVRHPTDAPLSADARHEDLLARVLAALCDR